MNAIKNLLVLLIASAMFAPLHAQVSVDSTMDTAVMMEQAADSGCAWNGFPVNIDTDGEIVRIFGDATLDIGDTCREMVVIGGNAVVHGHVEKDLVVIMGNLTLSGSVGHDVVVVGGTANITPTAIITGDLAAIGTSTSLSQNAVINGDKITIVPFLGDILGGFKQYLVTCLMKGRFFAPGIPWTMALLAGLAVLVLITGLLFTGPFARSTDTVDHNLVIALCIGLLTPVALGPVMAVLAFTVIGIPAIPVMFLVLAWAGLIGTAALCTQAGSRVVRGFGGTTPPALASGAIGAVIFAALTLVPFLGGIFTLILATLGTGIGIYALFTIIRDSTRNGRNGQTSTGPDQTSVSTTPAVPVSESTPLPVAPVSSAIATVARFWPRAGAALIDILLVMLVYGITFGAFIKGTGAAEHMHENPGIPLLLLVYLGIMWAWKQTTVGGIIFRLKIRRTDGGPLTPAVATVRALGLLLSIIPLGLGFLWIAWDEQRQGWHDKIAGTVVEQVPDGISLV